MRRRRFQRPEAQLAIEPKCARIERLIVLQAHLIRIHGEATDPQDLAEQAQQARIEPRRFALAERVIQVESHFGALEQRQHFHVAGGHTILEEHAGMVGA